MMELDEALMILTEIATGDQERKAICTVKETIYGLQNEAKENADVAERYRHLYESIQKKLMLYRDVAAMPDIPENPTANNPPDDTSRAAAVSSLAS